MVAKFNASQFVTQQKQASLLIRQQLTEGARDFITILDGVFITELSKLSWNLWGYIVLSKCRVLCPAPQAEPPDLENHGCHMASVLPKSPCHPHTTSDCTQELDS